MTTYVFGEAWARERERLAALEAVFDVGSQAHLQRLGIAQDASCLEVGAGGGSMACWLADRVGPRGRVVATDLDLTWVQHLGRSDIELRRHDIGTEDLEPGAFDVIHTRAVLEHVPGREAALSDWLGPCAPADCSSSRTSIWPVAPAWRGRSICRWPGG